MNAYAITIPKLRNFDEVDVELITAVVKAKEDRLSFAKISKIGSKSPSNLFKRLTKLVNAGYLYKNQISDKEVYYELTTISFLLVPGLAREIQKKMLNHLKEIGYKKSLEVVNRQSSNKAYFDYLEATGRLTQIDEEIALELFLRKVFSIEEVVKKAKALSKEDIREKFPELKRKNLSDLDYQFLANEYAISETIYSAEAGRKARAFIKELKK
jgi:predicted transcriptional regulator